MKKLITLLVLMALFSACVEKDFSKENPPQKVFDFCTEHYKGTVRGEKGAHGAGSYTYFCVLPNGNECEVVSLYTGRCLDYEGK